MKNEIIVSSFMPEQYRNIRDYVGLWYDAFGEYNSNELFRQVVHDGQEWYGLLTWGVATRASSARDHFIGWHDCQRAERIKLIAVNRLFFPRPDAPEKGLEALAAALNDLPHFWEKWYGYTPLLAESHLQPKTCFSTYYRANDWVNCDHKNPDLHPTHWVKELVPDARVQLRYKYLKKRNPASVKGLFPLSNTMLKSLKGALQIVPDSRKENKQYPLGSILSIMFMALLCGCDNIKQIQEFGTRVSDEQAKLLDFPFRRKKNARTAPGYYVYYPLLKELKMAPAVEILISWLEKNALNLPSVLSVDEEIVQDTLYAMNSGFGLTDRLNEKEYFQLMQQRKDSQQRKKSMKPADIRKSEEKDASQWSKPAMLR